MSCIVCYEKKCMCRPRVKTILIKKSLGQEAQTDYYKKVAALKFGVAYESVTPEMRMVVKASEFHTMYAPTSSPMTFKDMITTERRFHVVDYEKVERQIGACAFLGMSYGRQP